MFAKYVTTNAPTGAQVINDFLLLLSGAAISALSASCDKVNTTLTSTVAPGWTLIDSAAPLTGGVITAPDFDGLTTKFVNINLATATTIAAFSYESWNTSTKTGTNVSNITSSLLAFTAGTVNTYFIFATPRSFYIAAVTGSGIGSFEFARECEYLKGTTYPCHAIADHGTLTPTGRTAALSYAYTSRIKNSFAAGDLTGGSAVMQSATIGPRYSTVYAGELRSPPNIFDATGTSYLEMRPLWFLVGPSNASTGKPIAGKIFDVMEIPVNAGNTMDTFSDGISTYYIVNFSLTAYAFKTV